MKVAIFGGSFDPVHSEHVSAVRAAIAVLKLDKVIIVPTHIAPHKNEGAHAEGNARSEMCRLAFADIPCAEVSDFELSGGGTSYSYLTCRHFKELYPDGELYFLVGADMLEDFFTWKNPDDILNNVTLAAFSRGSEQIASLHGKFTARFQKDFVEIPFCGAEISSTDIRVKLAFGKAVPELDARVFSYIHERELYSHPAIAPALALEKEERREHSYRVAQLAARLARKYKITQDKAILASALHDCAKYVPLSSPLLKDFVSPEGVPAPVLHQFTGAYLAEHIFGITDEEVLDAIRYHTSGRGDMTALGKLIFLADMLEEGRSFDGVQALRKLLFESLDKCLLEALKRQIEYLQSEGKEIYSLTQEAFEWLKSKKTH